MATNHTTNYALNLWEANDKFVREEFNENTTKLDAAIKAEADARAAETVARTAAVAAIQTTLSGMVKLACGTYTGDGASSRVIEVGFPPKAVFVFSAYGYTYYSSDYSSSCYGGLALPGYPAGGSANTTVRISGEGFIVYNKEKGVHGNLSNEKYNYIALG